jgi:glutamine amidotransferase
VIAVLDYLQHLGADARLVDDPDEADEADGVVLPGVGAFGRCAQALRSSGLDRSARRAVESGVPFLGICVGFQLLYQGSDESPSEPGLGIFDGMVRRLPSGVKHPQMQWNQLEPVASGTGLLDQVPQPAWVYFVHSYAPDLTEDTTSTCEYGGPVTASAEQGRVWGTQFHPEKSGAVGLGILANFVRTVHDATR